MIYGERVKGLSCSKTGSRQECWCAFAAYIGNDRIVHMCVCGGGGGGSAQAAKLEINVLTYAIHTLTRPLCGAHQ